jgi:hypothetical protein
MTGEEESAQSFGLRLHAYVLMDNHYHLLLETPRSNLSSAMHWLNVSYSVWFDRRHQQLGHLFHVPGAVQSDCRGNRRALGPGAKTVCVRILAHSASHRPT